MHQEWRKAWDCDGLIHFKGALSPDLTQNFLLRLDLVYKSFCRGEIENFSIGEETATDMPGLWKRLLSSPRETQTFKKWNIVGLDPAFIPLIDHETVFPLILEIMGVNIQVFRSEFIIVPPGVTEKPYIHTDAGTLGQCFADRRFAPLMISVQYFLTDLVDDECGNFAYVPETQFTPFPDEEGTEVSGFVQGEHIEGRVQARVRAGDAIIFPHSLWHGASGNTRGDARKSIIIGYGQNFLRPYDYVEQSAATLSNCKTARQRRLLGDFGGWAWRPGCLHHPEPRQSAVMTGK